jgi:DNA-binding transcriptional MerR regulator
MIKIDSATAALALGVNADTVRRYGRDGLLTPYGPRNRRQYDIEEVRELAVTLSGPHNGA